MRTILEHFRNLLVAAMGNKIEKLVDLPSGEIKQLITQAQLLSAEALNQIFDMLFKAEVSIRLSPQPKLALEMTLIKLLQTRPALPIDVLIDKLDALRQEVSPAGKALQTAANHQSIEPEAPSLSSLPGEKPEGAEAENEDSSPVQMNQQAIRTRCGNESVRSFQRKILHLPPTWQSAV